MRFSLRGESGSCCLALCQEYIASTYTHQLHIYASVCTCVTFCDFFYSFRLNTRGLEHGWLSHVVAMFTYVTVSSCLDKFCAECKRAKLQKPEPSLCIGFMYSHPLTAVFVCISKSMCAHAYTPLYCI